MNSATSPMLLRWLQAYTTFPMKSKTRHRVSTNFLSIKIFLAICFAFLFFNFFFGDDSFGFNLHSVLWFFLTAIFLGGFFYFLETRKIIEFDNMNNLYVFDKKRSKEIKISLDRIEKILFSGFGLNLFSFSNYSYRIVYRDNNSQLKKVRLFPRTGRDDISTIIKMTRIANPNVKVCNWSFGWNELLD